MVNYSLSAVSREIYGMLSSVGWLQIGLVLEEDTCKTIIREILPSARFVKNYPRHLQNDHHPSQTTKLHVTKYATVLKAIPIGGRSRLSHNANTGP